jgi:hypothetical protein
VKNFKTSIEKQTVSDDLSGIHFIYGVSASVRLRNTKITRLAEKLSSEKQPDKNQAGNSRCVQNKIVYKEISY